MLRGAELFAGVGGFRIGIERAGGAVVWSNQWEPGSKLQHASEVYVKHFGPEGHVNEDIARHLRDVETGQASLPDFNLLVGGFPCQDYSVAKSLSTSDGIQGKKGVLWWEIFRLIQMKRPAYVLLENVDRLLVSPASQRGRDFAIMIKSLSTLGYSVEWKVINAADFGHAQRRKRVFIFASPALFDGKSIFEGPFPSVISSRADSFRLTQDLFEISKMFNADGKKSPFLDSGRLEEDKVTTWSSKPLALEPRSLGTVLLPISEVPEEYWLEEDEIPKWEYLKGSKSLVRTGRGGFQYTYSEGSMSFPDKTDKPSRTIVTGEGGRTPSRFKHVVDQGGRLRRLTPIELERLNEFPDNWTHSSRHGNQVPDSRRAFLMGNALVVGVVEKLIRSLKRLHEAQL